MIDNRFAQGKDGLSDNMALAQTILDSIATIDNISGIGDMHDAISSTLGMIGEKTGAALIGIGADVTGWMCVKDLKAE